MVLFTFPMWTSHLRIWTMLFVWYVLSYLHCRMTCSPTEFPSIPLADSLAPTIIRMRSGCGFQSSSLLSWIYTGRWFPCSTPRPALNWNNKIVILLQLGCLQIPVCFEMLLLMLYFTLTLINASIFIFVTLLRMLSSQSITMILLKCWCVQTIQRVEETLIHCTTPYQLGLRFEVISK